MSPERLHGGKVEPLVKGARAGCTIAHPGHCHQIPTSHAGAQCDAGGHRNGIAQHTYRTNHDRLIIGLCKSAIGCARTRGRAGPLGQIHDVDIQIAAARVRVGPRHVLQKNFARTNADRHQRAHVSYQGEYRVPTVEGVGRRDGLAFLSEAAVETTDDFALTKEDDEPLLDFPREPREVVHLEKLVAGQCV